MPWPIPPASSIFNRMASAMEQNLILLTAAKGLTASVSRISLAVRSAQGVFSNLFAPIAGEIRSLHDHQAWWGRQYMPDSADDEEMILRHAGIWGVEGRAAVKAKGAVLIDGAAGTGVASGLILSAGNAQTYVTTSGGTLDAGGTLAVTAEAVNAGAPGNLAAGIILTADTSPDGLSRFTVSASFAGGLDAETPEEIKASYLRRIRMPPMGGAAQDYFTWVSDVASPYAVATVEDWIGRGSLGVVVVMKNADGTPRQATPEELATIGTHLGVYGSQTGVRPVTARTIPVAGILVPVPISVRLRPDTALTRAAVEAAFLRFVLTIGDEDDDQNAGPIGAFIEPSRISEAISSATAEYGHDLVVPAARYKLGVAECPIAGSITWLS